MSHEKRASIKCWHFLRFIMKCQQFTLIVSICRKMPALHNQLR